MWDGCYFIHVCTHTYIRIQVNRIKISSDKDDPLGFAMKLLDSAAQTLTLSVLRQTTAMSQGNYGGFPLTPGLANTPISPLPGTLSMSTNPLEYEIDRRYRKISSGGIIDSNQPLSLQISRPPYYKYTSVSCYTVTCRYFSWERERDLSP